MEVQTLPSTKTPRKLHAPYTAPPWAFEAGAATVIICQSRENDHGWQAKRIRLAPPDRPPRKRPRDFHRIAHSSFSFVREEDNWKGAPSIWRQAMRSFSRTIMSYSNSSIGCWAPLTASETKETNPARVVAPAPDREGLATRETGIPPAAQSLNGAPRPEANSRYARGMLIDLTDRGSSEHEKTRLRPQNAYLLNAGRGKANFGDIIAVSSGLRSVMRQVRLVASTEATVLISGESGTGKELIARAIHEGSARNHHALVKLNCAAVPETLFESEFFGHMKGAF